MADPLDDLPDAVSGIIAKQAITEVLHRYCHALDRNDRPMADTIWHVGGLAHYAEIFEGTGAGFLDWVFEQHKAFAATSHQVTNILVSVDGERATSETYVTMCGQAVDYDVVSRGRYSDTWTRRDGVWGIDERTYHDDIRQLMPRGT